MRIRRCIAALLACLAAGAAYGQGVAITQIDTGRLLQGQTVRLYLSVPGYESTDGALPDIEVWESGADKEYARRPIKAIARDSAGEEGIAFFFLLDNSGSMWTGLDGNKAAEASEERIAHAKAAVRAFLRELSPKDSVGLAVFNTRYRKAVDPTRDLEAIDRGLDEIRKPASEDAYTELYLSIDQALSEFAKIPGRRALVVLSDGENFPYYGSTGKPNPETGVRTASPADVIARANKEGITAYVVRFGDDKDPSLGSVALGSGGAVFDASNKKELAAVYSTIREAVLNEVAVDYAAGMEPGSTHFVKAVLRQGGREYSSERYYYAGTVLGWSEAIPRWYYFLFLLGPALLWLGLLFLKLERETSEAGLRLLYGPAGRATKAFGLSSSGRTVVGSSDAADITISGNPSLRRQHATILFDKARNAYTVVGDADLTVNNREVSKKRLEPGDVINMAGTVVVFEDKLTTSPKGAEPNKK